MDPIATQEWSGVMGRCMAYARIRVCSAPGKNGSADDDQIAGSRQADLEGQVHQQDDQRFTGRCPGHPPAFAQLAFARDTWVASSVEW